MSVKSRKISETCVLCFSRGRRLCPIGVEHWSILQNALDNSPLKYSRDLPNKCQYRVCWECRARLRSAARFLEKVQRSFNCFEDYLASPGKSPPPPRSRLLRTHQGRVDIAPCADAGASQAADGLGTTLAGGLGTTLAGGLKLEAGSADDTSVAPYKVEQDFLETEKCPQVFSELTLPKRESDILHPDNCQDNNSQDDNCQDDNGQDDNGQDDNGQDDNGQDDNSHDDNGQEDSRAKSVEGGEARTAEDASLRGGDGGAGKAPAEEGGNKKGAKRGRKGSKSPAANPSKSQFSRQWMSTEEAMGWLAAEAAPGGDGGGGGAACALCRRVFSKEEELTAHLLEIHHESVGPYECNICKHRFAQQTALLEHTEAHYVLYKCRKCQYETKTLALMQSHSRSHAGKREALKPEASKGAGGKAARGSERARKKGEKRDSYQCRRCKESFVSFPLLQQHRAACSTYRCDQCEASFGNSGALYRHAKTHREGAEPLHYCATCDTHYKASWFKKHFEISLKHVTRDAYKHECPHCGRRFLALRRLREHVGSVHLKLGIHKCHLCPKSYMNEKVLKMHQAKIHSIDKVEKKRDKICEHCGKGFTCNLYLKNHMRSHTGERPFACSLCSRAFAQSGTLYTHIKTVHRKRLSKTGCTDSPGYQCEECGKQFVTNARLQAHYNFYHLKNTNYKCDDCNKMFISVAALKCHRANRHATITTRSLACTTCGKEFRTASARHTHMKTPRPGGVYCA